MFLVLEIKICPSEHTLPGSCTPIQDRSWASLMSRALALWRKPSLLTRQKTFLAMWKWNPLSKIFFILIPSCLLRCRTLRLSMCNIPQGDTAQLFLRWKVFEPRCKRCSPWYQPHSWRYHNLCILRLKCRPAESYLTPSYGPRDCISRASLHKVIGTLCWSVSSRVTGQTTRVPLAVAAPVTQLAHPILSTKSVRAFPQSNSSSGSFVYTRFARPGVLMKTT